MTRLEVVGKKFNFLTAIRYDHNDKNNNAYWLFKCDCGKEHIASVSLVNKGRIKSCGCYRDKRNHDPRPNYKRSITKIHIIHGFARNNKPLRFYAIWAGIKTRCLCVSCNKYPYYGGKGIRVCKEWYKFLNFKEDMYEEYIKHVQEYGENDTSIDRIDPNGNYEKSNCRWATGKVQANNRKKDWC